MKFPVHISLDMSINPALRSSNYWVFRYLKTYDSHLPFLDFYSFQKKFVLHKENLLLSKVLKEQKKFTVWHSRSAKYSLTKRDLNLSCFETLLSERTKVKRKPILSNYTIYKIKTTIFENNNKNDKKKIEFEEHVFTKFYKFLISKKTINFLQNSNLWNLFDLNFLKKEKIYTKLKYSRVPQYDVVSGGSAALFAGFLGFLICEKFGLELLDSGDFYILLMYLIFFFFFCRLFLQTVAKGSTSWNFLSIKWFLSFYKILFYFLINKIKLIFKK